MKIMQGICPGRAFAFYIPHFDHISVKISVLGVLYPYWSNDKGIGPKVHSSVPNFTPNGAMCRPSGAKNLKIGLRVT